MTDTTTATTYALAARQLPAGEARAAVFTRHYDAAIEDVWDACTNVERLRRWWQPVEGDLRLGGRFTQGDFGPGLVLRCEAPRLLTIAVGGGDPHTDQIELRLTASADGGTDLEFEHATCLDTHEIGGQIYDAVYCMGGGYGPRLVTLEQHLNGTLPADVDLRALHLRDDYRAPINDSMAALDELLISSGQKRV
ncbi:MAG: hypothetical protein JWN31_1939 [Frankiales bacterium]|nr:hypothetical protein [Frankiales bacterium]